MTGELCSQPPDGVAETMLPQRSTTSTWQVSPRVVPSGSVICSPVRATVGSPTPAPVLNDPEGSVTCRGNRGGRPSG